MIHDTASILHLRSSDDLERLLELSDERPVMILKHSTRCPISSFARREFEEYATGAASRGVSCALVLVVEDRPLSLEIAAQLGVRHQSPQAILLRERRAVWNDSHERLTAAALREAEGA
jgi:bacillithiol system protein YtxJ